MNPENPRGHARGWGGAVKGARSNLCDVIPGCHTRLPSCGKVAEDPESIPSTALVGVHPVLSYWVKDKRGWATRSTPHSSYPSTESIVGRAGVLGVQGSKVSESMFSFPVLLPPRASYLPSTSVPHLLYSSPTADIPPPTVTPGSSDWKSMTFLRWVQSSVGTRVSPSVYMQVCACSATPVTRAALSLAGPQQLKCS